MKRCYERENWLSQFGHFENYHWGSGVTLEDGQRYCLLDGRLLDYVDIVATADSLQLNRNR